MNTSGEENMSKEDDTRKQVSKARKKKMQVLQLPTSQIGCLQRGAPYSGTSAKIKNPNNINWHDSEWPELPKPSLSSSHLDSKCTQSVYEGTTLPPLNRSSPKRGDKITNKTELAEAACDEFNCLQEKDTSQEEGMNTDSSVQNHLTFSSKELENITCSLTALNMTFNQCEQPTVQHPVNEQAQHSCLGKRLLKNQKNCFKTKSFFSKSQSSCVTQVSGEKNEKVSPLKHNNQSPLCEDDFPDLLTVNMIKKERKKFSPPVEDLNIKKQAKKYPRKNDPIFFNLGEVLEHTTCSRDCRSLMGNRYLKDRMPTHGTGTGTRTNASRRIIKRGKQREFPKRKTLTKLKLAILRGRQEKLKSRLANSMSPNQNASKSDLCEENTKTSEYGNLSEEVTLFKDCQTYLGEENILAQRSSDSHCSQQIETIVATEEKKETILSNLTEQSSSNYSYEVARLAKSSIHTRKFREYCNNDNSATLEDKVKSFVKQIYRFQTKSHFRDAEKARIHRRYTLGLREAEKYFKLRKLKVLIIATDLESNAEEGGLDEIIENIKSRACLDNVPVIFALKRRDLAYCVFRKVPVSCMAVLNYEGAEELYRAMIDAWKDATLAYDKNMKEKQNAILQRISEEQITDSARSTHIEKDNVSTSSSIQEKLTESKIEEFDVLSPSEYENNPVDKNV